ncbi:hypothetical protein NIE88_04005 [Sporolactobacillus shoreicorticis]|uniref:Uncharacterized protein n=1 Tax=Sporolactobacillus shoreicorticis TaxID=1923877 RepID=A0ABW5RY50_9BACL|nr:hypothetical protein [Sporolactobacillus shoreicorticis]MCO7124939.1 hypothetical protein [Sporolactobacillus shoreicorticis]
MRNDSNNKGAGLNSDNDGDKKRRQHSNTESAPFCEDHVISELKVSGPIGEAGIWLDAAVEWRPAGILPFNRISLSTSISMRVPALIQIWRRDKTGHTFITEKAETSPAIVVLTGDHGGFIFFNRVTTTIFAVDHTFSDGGSDYVMTFTADPKLPEGISLNQSKVTGCHLLATLFEDE